MSLTKTFPMRIPALSCFFSLFFILHALFGIPSAEGQTASTGRITGVITDANTGVPIGNATVQVVGTTIGTLTSDDGRFELREVSAGTKVLAVRRIGYAPKQITNVQVQAGETTEQNITIETTVTELQAQRITAAADRGTVAAALSHQRKAPAIVNAITSEQISKSPDGDAAQAVQRVSGVTVQDGKYVFVRGLGERYTTTSLNGSRIPSPEPEKREVPLDLFPTGLIQGIITSKTFTPDQSGDFGGAAVDIQTREFPLKRVFTYSSAFGFNTVATGQALPTGPRTGLEWLGFGGREREQPKLINEAIQSGDQATINRAIRSFRNEWQPVTQRVHPNYSLAASFGGRTQLVNHRLGYIASATYSRSQDVRANERRAIAVSKDGTGINLGIANPFVGQSTTSSVLWGGLFNMSTLLGERTRLLLNNTYNRSADNEATEMAGTRSDDDLPTQRSTLRFIERSVRSNQLRIERMFTDRDAIAVTITSSGVSRKEPDRTEIDYVQLMNPNTGERDPYTLAVGYMDGARKSFGDLSESNFNTTLDYTRGILKLGGSLRYTNRTALNNSYSIIGTNEVTRDILEQSPSEIFAGAATEGATHFLTIRQNTLGGSYEATDAVGAGYVMATYPIGSRLQLIGGARVEFANMEVRSQSNTGEKHYARLRNTDLLPALNAQISLTDKQQVRLGITQTLSRPEYREISPISQIDLTTYQEMFGNANLVRSLIQNYDARWEWYPRPGEIISFGLFAKRFNAPIERVDVATSGKSQISFINANSGHNYGFEIELRKQLDIIAGTLSPFTFFTNTTVMKSSIDLTGDNLSSFTNKKRPMLGQAPYVVNAGLNYANPTNRVTGSILYNVVGKRIRAGGGTPLPDVYELPRHVLDFSLQIPFMSGISAKFDIRNLLNAPYETRQGSITRTRYDAGRSFSLGIRWQP
jgi:hypothetical protein